MKIKRALLSVWNKDGIIELGKFLVQQNIEILSTGGTQTALEAAGLKVTTIGDVTGSGTVMDGRVKTLHPKVFGRFLDRIGDAPVLLGVVLRDLILRNAVEVGAIPGQDAIGVIAFRNDLRSSFEHEHLQATLGEFLSAPASAHS